jgi:Zn-dependent protease with chaperone function/type II secretory pathway pseudopilin PulG
MSGGPYIRGRPHKTCRAEIERRKDVKDELVYPRENTLGAITLVFGLIGWLLIVVGTLGLALVYLLFGFLFYVFAHSAFISWLRGNSVLLSQAQLPDLRARFEACCKRLGLDETPEAYLMQGGGALNAFATRFLGRNYVILLSDIVDAMDEHPDGVNFYFGHELGHIRRHHLTGNLLRAPVLWLPLLGAAYSRAKESTCDRHGRACCESPESAARALVALAAGAKRWKEVDLPAYAGQAALTRGFWMSFHELTNGYPWLTKRTVRVLDPAAPVPRRNPVAWLLALFVPYTGRAGGGLGGIVILAAIIGILAAVAIPAYQDYVVRAQLQAAYVGSEPARQALGNWFVQHDREPPETLQQAGIAPTLPDGSTLSYDPEQMVLTVETRHGELVFVPENPNDPTLSWRCVGGEGIKQSALPAPCRGANEAPAPR